MSKWVCIIMKNLETGNFRAYLTIDNKQYKNIKTDVNYSTLKNDILNKTGLRIPDKIKINFTLCKNEKIAVLISNRYGKTEIVPKTEWYKYWTYKW